MIEFEVKLFVDDTSALKARYKAAWHKGRYYAENLRVELDTNEGSAEYISGYNTLDSVISEAEGQMLYAKFGIATIYDGKYRIAVITKKYHEECSDSNYTNYGKTCRTCEYIPKLSGPFYDEMED